MPSNAIAGWLWLSHASPSTGWSTSICGPMIGSISAGNAEAARTPPGRRARALLLRRDRRAGPPSRSRARRVDPGGAPVPDRGPARRVAEVVPAGRGARVRRAGDAHADLEVARAGRRRREAEALVQPLRGVAQVLDRRPAREAEVAVVRRRKRPRARPARACHGRSGGLEDDGRRAGDAGGDREALLGDARGVGRRAAGPRAGVVGGTEGEPDLADDRAEIERRGGARGGLRGGRRGRGGRRCAGRLSAHAARTASSRSPTAASRRRERHRMRRSEPRDGSDASCGCAVGAAAGGWSR